MMLRPTPVNLLGIVEHAEMTPFVSYRIDRDGRPYVPVGDAGVVLGVSLGDSVFGTDTDHVAPGVTLAHPDPSARFALTAYACIGNEVRVRTGVATGATGVVVGKRGEAGRVIARFPDEVMAQIRPGDQMAVRGFGQGYQPPLAERGVRAVNLDPRLLDALPVRVTERALQVQVVATLPSRVCGNGIGRPVEMWDVDLAVQPGDDVLGGADLRLGDLVAIADLDVRHNMGFRSGWVTVGIICHGSSPLPGHGPGLVPVLTGPGDVLAVTVSVSPRPGITDEILRVVPAAAAAAR